MCRWGKGLHRSKAGGGGHGDLKRLEDGAAWGDGEEATWQGTSEGPSRVEPLGPRSVQYGLL